MASNSVEIENTKENRLIQVDSFISRSKENTFHHNVCYVDVSNQVNVHVEKVILIKQTCEVDYKV